MPVGYRFDADRLWLTFPVGAFPPLVPSDRVSSLYKMKQLAIAVFNYAEVYDRNLPPPALTAKGKSGTPLLSWRVALLPFIEQEDLYKQFRLDEPWDSEHNKKLIAKMPNMFTTPGANAPAGQTHYLAFTGPGTAFETDKDGRSIVKFRDITDGTSNTLLFVEAAEPVVWTKPDDLPFDPKKLPKLGVSPDGVNVAFVDGSVRTLVSPPNDSDLRAMVTRNGGEVVTIPSVKPAKPSGGTTLECVRADFRPLFNGNDLTGWTDLAPEASAWKVEGTELVGRNRKEANLIANKEYTHFHMRAEVKMTGTGAAGMYFVGGSDARAPGVGVDLTNRKGVPFGSLVSAGKVVAESSERTTPKDWFRLEVISINRRWRVLIDGRQVAEYRQPEAHERTGPMLHQSSSPAAGDDLVVRYRQIEIRELPPPAGTTEQK